MAIYIRKICLNWKMEPSLNNVVNDSCPWSGKPVAEDSLTYYNGSVVGFCNSGCRDKFAKAVEHFEKAVIASKSRPAIPSVELPNLASSVLGAKIVFATDEWFAAAENLLKDEEAVWLQDDYTPFGKWMDGWESRRRRTEGHDWCILKLGVPGIIKKIEIDTLHFTGNFSPKASVYGAYYAEDTEEMLRLDELRNLSKQERPEFGRMGLSANEEEFSLVSALCSESWKILVPLTPLGAGYAQTSKTVFEVAGNAGPVSHIRLNMGPDGGIARIRIYGEVVVQLDKLSDSEDIDLAAVGNGGLALAWSNKHYGHPRNLIVPGRGNCMGDGWETARQPARPAVYQKGEDGLMVLPGCDWALLKLGIAGFISSLEVDTHFYKGNYPESCLIEACHLSSDAMARRVWEDDSSLDWKVLLPRTRLTPDSIHTFSLEQRAINSVGLVSLIKLTIYPDGGVMRLRVMGRRPPDSRL